ncbi:mannonate dehydratase [Herbinix luporum]|uniref:Mannonate dehydratase n=1 Tax=Herbinix luporum TaxID=1679721 RepID=A0A0K8J381_9FIRM|nr:mannonate dehydratase [Herbinix luporum]MDI9489373.1 mannonate dehydratase [Bacillota bacterium]CUH91819.1 Mannonate dehydratase [Herbinix luporum]HHT57236.1 mannonate dehydratase [Herbinix luporum]
MDMTLRWFGKKHDSVKLEYIKQIPGVTGVVSSLHDVPAGEPWKLEDILELKKEVEKAGLKLIGIESVNIHEDIKIGLPSREKYIENYKISLENLGKADVHMVCYNFMPIFDWTRTELAKQLEDGSYVMAYDENIIKGIKPETMFERMEKESGGFILPGWEPNRRDEIMDLFEKYKGVTKEKLMENLKYFLDAIMPVCEKYQIKMALHPDDPAWSVFGLPRIVTSEKALEEIALLNDSIYNGFTLCTGSLGSNLNNNLPQIIRNPKISNRIHFVHLRNMKFESDGVFYESSHLSCDGNFDMYEIVKALYDIGFDGVVRPDHGRMIWDEQARPGYGLYDRALGVAYLNGLWEAIRKNDKSNK